MVWPAPELAPDSSSAGGMGGGGHIWKLVPVNPICVVAAPPAGNSMNYNDPALSWRRAAPRGPDGSTTAAAAEIATQVTSTV